MIDGDFQIGDDRAVDEPDGEADPVERGRSPTRSCDGSLAVSIEPPMTVSVTSDADREIEAPAHQHEELAGGQDRQRRGAAQEVHEAGGLEIGRLPEPDGEIQREEHDHRDIDAARPRQRHGDLGPIALQRDGHATWPRVRIV